MPATLTATVTFWLALFCSIVCFVKWLDERE